MQQTSGLIPGQAQIIANHPIMAARGTTGISRRGPFVLSTSTIFACISVEMSEFILSSVNVQVQCGAGMRLEGGRAKYRCRGGDWRPALPVCQPRDCHVPRCVSPCLDNILYVIINNICWQPPPRHALAARPRPCPARRPPHRHLPLRLQARRRRHAALRPRYMRSEENILQLANKR